MTRRTPDEYDWATQDFDEMLLPTTGTGRRATTPRRGKVRHIDIHHMTVGDSDDGAANRACVQIWKTRQASAHYGIDNDHVAQFVYDNAEAWGNANTKANQEGIILEHANSTLAPNWEVSDKTIASSVRLVANLHVTHKLGRPTSSGFGAAGTIRTHQSFYSTACPGPYFKKIWASYVERVQAEYDRITRPTVPAPVPPVVEPATTHTVAGGDTLWGIAYRHKVTVDQLAEWNNLGRGSFIIQPGQVLRLTPSEPVTPTGPLVETISANLAGYDVKYGLKTRVRRARIDIPGYLLPKRPLWFHFQECAVDMWPELDKRLTGYTRVAAGGKGRESYYRTDAGVKILDARLHNVTHMLLKDTKEFLVIVWEIDGHRAVDVNFHNENEGSTFQALQLWDVLKAGNTTAEKWDVPKANILFTGDTNLKTFAAFALGRGWRDVIDAATKKIDLQYHSTNGWRAALTTGNRIDGDIVHPSAEVLEAEQLFGAVISDHWPHRVIRRLTK